METTINSITGKVYQDFQSAKTKADYLTDKTSLIFYVIYDDGNPYMEGYHICDENDLDTFFYGIEPLYCSD